MIILKGKFFQSDKTNVFNLEKEIATVGIMNIYVNTFPAIHAFFDLVAVSLPPIVLAYKSKIIQVNSNSEDSRKDSV